jgi:CheY-like chemotaxis protein
MISKIMCIDDDPIALKICDLYLKKNFPVDDLVSFNNGEDALKYFGNMLELKQSGHNSISPQLVFLDLSMPCMNGFEFLDIYEEKFTRRFPNTKIIVLSSTIDPHEKAKALKYLSVLDFICKPISAEDIKRLKLHDFVINNADE